MRLHSLPPFALLLLTSAAAAQTVHVVDIANGPGTDFDTIAAAVSAAAPDDVLLVRAGNYPESLALGAKPLTVTAEAGASVRVHGISVNGLAAGEMVVVRGFEALDNVVPGISCANSAGSIWIENCTVLATVTFFGPAAGVTVTDCDRVVLSGCTVDGPLRLSMSNDTFLSTRSRVFVYDSTVVGGSYDRMDGWTGMVVNSGSVFLSGSTVTGGAGQDGVFVECQGGDGGAGLRLTGTTPTVPSVFAQDCTVAGGEGGTGTCGDGVDGDVFVPDEGTFNGDDTPARSFVATSPVRDDESFSGVYFGPEHDRVWLMYSLTPSGGTASSLLIHGRLLLGAPRVRLLRGEIGPSGSLAESVPLGDLGPGVEALRVFAQPIVLNNTLGHVAFGSPQAIVVLDSSF